MRDESGLTVIELLAAMVILALLSATLYGVFFGFHKNYEQISGKNSIDQAANVILATIKDYHQKNDFYYISYDTTDQTAYIGKDKADIQLGDSRFKVDLQAGNPDPETLSGQVTILSSEPLSIRLKLKDHDGQAFEIETIIKRY